jgi:glycosyltransferase involved in cell wall biosynthesis
MIFERGNALSFQGGEQISVLRSPRYNRSSADSKCPSISVIVPCRNEERYIAACLDSLLPSSSADGQLEILVVDGMSRDKTREIVAEYGKKEPLVRLVDNPAGTIPAAMNIGVRNARGQVILKIDAHSNYPRDYISNCVESLTRFEADNAGGIVRILPANESLTAKSIAVALAHRFASGNAYVKVGAKGPCWADSAAFGCWRKEVLEKIGGWNEKLGGSSDMDLNARLKEAGGRILLNPDIQISYYADANFRSYWKHNFADGVWATYVLKFRSRAWAWRHWVPMAFLLSLLISAGLVLISRIFGLVFMGILGCYVLVNLAAMIQISFQEKSIKYLLLLPLAFGIRHFAHGVGALYGAILLVLPGEHWKGRRGTKQ